MKFFQKLLPSASRVGPIHSKCLRRAVEFNGNIPSIRSISTTTASSPSPSATPTESAPTLQVSEIFKSIQGEGPFTGRPSIFLRLGICNLSCAWCDTPYTWLFTNSRLQKVQNRLSASSTSTSSFSHSSQPLTVYDKSLELERSSVQDVINKVTSLSDGGTVRNVVITGGEPLLHKKPLLHAVDTFLKHGMSVEFETNGTISPVGLPNSTNQVHLNVSPKLSNSLQPRESRINHRVLMECLAFPSSILKFVVDDRKDVNEMLDVVAMTGVESHRVYLMPQGSVSLFFFFSFFLFLNVLKEGMFPRWKW